MALRKEPQGRMLYKAFLLIKPSRFPAHLGRSLRLALLGRSMASLLPSTPKFVSWLFLSSGFLGPMCNSNPRLQDGDAEVLESKAEEEILGEWAWRNRRVL